MLTIFAVICNVNSELWWIEILKIFACTKFVGASTVDYLTKIMAQVLACTFEIYLR